MTKVPVSDTPKPGEAKAGRDDPEFPKRREAAREKVNALDRGKVHSQPERTAFFNDVYVQAAGDAAYVPWADMKPKDELVQWLRENPGISSASTSSPVPSAVDIACGLGDNAEAMAAAGYETTAFDLSADAIDWAKRRFPESPVKYCQADLFAPPEKWLKNFDLVHECFTLQALPPQMLGKTAAAIAALAAPGADLLVYTRWRKDGAPVDGPPWPLEESRLDCFAALGFERITETRFTVEKAATADRPARVIPHAFTHWRRVTQVT
ncbi:class I SAM-dependent methyltransferase [Salaquimonas pukyongi]|uniref:class I SAM-dependent methyltransferase n=1 Tax=Salaquimonas pukyongi TaxID=2712698 RepID=UPI00196780C4|nr:class I SAM-dependent methyltransferase [Salaquimonas pukyongi]